MMELREILHVELSCNWIERTGKFCFSNTNAFSTTNSSMNGYIKRQYCVWLEKIWTWFITYILVKFCLVFLPLTFRSKLEICKEHSIHIITLLNRNGWKEQGHSRVSSTLIKWTEPIITTALYYMDSNTQTNPVLWNSCVQLKPVSTFLNTNSKGLPLKSLSKPCAKRLSTSSKDCC